MAGRAGSEGHPGSAELLHQVDLVMPPWVGRRTTALNIASAGVEPWCLERVGAQRHLLTAAPTHLLLRRGQDPCAQPGPALVGAHPQKLDVATATPGPATKPRQQLSVRPACRHPQQSAIIQARRRDVERVDLIVKPVVQAIVDVAYRDHDLTHYRLLASHPFLMNAGRPRPGTMPKTLPKPLSQRRCCLPQLTTLLLEEPTCGRDGG